MELLPNHFLPWALRVVRLDWFGKARNDPYVGLAWETAERPSAPLLNLRMCKFVLIVPLARSSRGTNDWRTHLP